jgi:hypothetical protein
MDNKRVTSREAELHPQRQPFVLAPADLAKVSGGLNPQPLPPGDERMRD